MQVNILLPCTKIKPYKNSRRIPRILWRPSCRFTAEKQGSNRPDRTHKNCSLLAK